MKNHIRLATKNDLPEILRVFGSSIQAIPNTHYSQAQKLEWLKTIENTNRWEQALNQQLFWVVEVDKELAGFISLVVERGYIDFLYVDPKYWGQGLAKSLLTILQEFSVLNKLSELQSDVSITAKPFFERNGFQVLNRNENLRGKEVLVNFSMRKDLTTA